jgi:hypothetical protein
MGNESCANESAHAHAHAHEPQLPIVSSLSSAMITGAAEIFAKLILRGRSIGL